MWLERPEVGYEAGKWLRPVDLQRLRVTSAPQKGPGQHQSLLAVPSQASRAPFSQSVALDERAPDRLGNSRRASAKQTQVLQCDIHVLGTSMAIRQHDTSLYRCPSVA
jgi:hypothetical protein